MGCFVFLVLIMIFDSMFKLMMEDGNAAIASLIVTIAIFGLYENMKEKDTKQKIIDKILGILQKNGIQRPISVDLLDKTEENAEHNAMEPLKRLHLRKEDIVDSKSSFGVCAFKHNALIGSIQISYKANQSDLDLLAYFLNADKRTFDNARIAVGKNATSKAKEDELNSYYKHMSIVAPCAASQLYLSFAQIIKVSDIEYYKIEGNMQYASNVTGGGADIEGAIVGGVIAGSAGAVVGGQGKVKTEIVKKDARILYICYNKDGVLRTDEISSDNLNLIIDLFHTWIPEKEYQYITAQSAKETAQKKISHHSDSAQAGRAYAELKELKELLDMDIITQEEFERKKKQILG